MINKYKHEILNVILRVNKVIGVDMLFDLNFHPKTKPKNDKLSRLLTHLLRLT